ncbi:MAG TPA: lipocalin family protein [Candidatus Syntrophosphaera sp.]|nr:lipocalin family protein [Candidatus Syntrophosphaera sp.]
MQHIIAALILLLLLSPGLAAKVAKGANPVQTVASVDLQRYLGRWYQQAFFPARFQKADCGKVVTAEYSLLKNGKIRVINTCYSDAAGTVVKRRAQATAYPVDKTNAKLKVSFFWPFKGDYWIVKLDRKNYSYTVVSDPGRDYLWILTRQMAIDKKTYEEITDFLRDNGWDLSRLVFTGKLK